VSEEHLPLRPRDYLILVALSGGELHGYGLIREIEGLTDSAVRMDPANLYRALRRLCDQELVAESESRPAPDADDERRRYYAITEAGRRVAAAESRRLEQLTAVARQRRLLTRRGSP
jgi:DNA-binding PadR family transcriptional regulator